MALAPQPTFSQSQPIIYNLQSVLPIHWSITYFNSIDRCWIDIVFSLYPFWHIIRFDMHGYGYAYLTVLCFQKPFRFIFHINRFLCLIKITLVSILFRILLTQLRTHVYREPLSPWHTHQIPIFDWYYKFDTQEQVLCYHYWWLFIDPMHSPLYRSNIGRV
jgi:hypothetical protein